MKTTQPTQNSPLTRLSRLSRLTRLSRLSRLSRLARISLCAGLLLLPCASRAADVDIYSGLTSAAGAPNILIVFDNAANFSSNAAAGAGTCNITGNTEFNPANPLNGTANSLAGTVGGIEQCAFYSVLRALPTNTDGSARVNIGFMVYNSSGIHDIDPTTGLPGLNCGGSNGGCLVYSLQPMSGTKRTSMLNWITTWQTSNGGAGSYWIKAAGEATAAAMQEAWAYYEGNIGMSGRAYPGIAGGCQKNFVVFLGNSYSSSGTPGDGGSASPVTYLNTAYGTNPQPTPMPILAGKNTSCGAFTFPSGNNHETGGYYADEWTRFMYSTDISANTGVQNIVTYTIGVLGASCQASYAALLDSMAGQGGGKYFPTSDDASIVQALLKILNEVQSVNSVFSAATLPVSVNTQGTYLNQIYMGMFRPDASGYPRWVGNVKQFQFQFDINKNLYLADATGQPAISSGGTGFIVPYSASFWSCTNSTNAATLTGPASPPAPLPPYTQYSALPICNLDPSVGFFANYPDYVAHSNGGAFDLPDGEVVEKGGAGQQLRLANLTDNYTTSPTGPRKMYTYCPPNLYDANGNCIGDTTAGVLSNSINQFATTNTALMPPTPSVFGTGLSLAITSLTRLGTTASATTFGNHGLVVGSTVTISGSTPNDYNGTVIVTGVSAGNKFNYTVPEYPPCFNNISSPCSATTTTTGGVGGYVANYLNPGYAISGLSRPAAGTAANVTLTVTTAAALPTPAFANGTVVNISGITPFNYNLTQAISNLTSSGFQFVATGTAGTGIAVYPPPAPATTNSYKADMATNVTFTGVSSNCNSTSKVVTYATSASAAHGFLTGDYVTISGDTGSGAKYNGSYNVTVTSSSQFTVTFANCPNYSGSGLTAQSGPAAPLTANLSRNETAVGTATVTVTTATASQFAQGDQVNISYSSATPQPAGETYYLSSSAVINCVNWKTTAAAGTCGTQFSYTISTAPATPSAGSTAQVVLPSTAPNQAIASLTRGTYGATPSDTTATVVLAAGSPGFCNGESVSIMTAPGTTLASKEGPYTGSWTITGVTAAGTITCANGTTGTGYTTFTYGALATTPVSPATGSILASNPSLSPDSTTLINWVRGEDNFGGESSLCPPGSTAGTAPCPSTAVTVRPSVHGDVLHSRPIAVNYGGTTGVVVYYGTNDGVYHAINGNQSTNIGTVKPGGELWGFVAADFYGKLNRQRLNSPALLLPSTPPGINPSPQPKDYFIDGPTGQLQERDTAGNITKAILYIGTRRGGRFMYAVDVTAPLSPVIKWKISNSTPGFSELGQTWSLPKVAHVKGYANPVLIFGAGYDDGSQDAEPPLADNMGRGIFIIDAYSGVLVWTAQPQIQGASTDYYWHRTSTYAGETCGGTTTQGSCLVDGMNYSIAADLSLEDRDNDAFVDRIYATDVGGNLWRVDLEPAQVNAAGADCSTTAAGCTPDIWQVTQVAALGCATGPCDLNGAAATAPGTSPGTPRKFFFPVEIMNATLTSNYDAIFLGSGDREHPLYSQQAYGVTNRMYMVKDYNTGKDSVSQLLPHHESNLDDCTGTTGSPNTCSTATTGASTTVSYDLLTSAQQHDGYYVTLGTGEKVVNAPLAVTGTVFFGTNQPAVPSANSCTTNLGIARGYALNPFSSVHSSIVYDGGGLPPSPVSGIVQIGNQLALFCVGCGGLGGSTADSHSSVGSTRLKPKIPSKRGRNYWYIQGK